MAYQALYRVWRPQTFSEVVGQKIVTQTLRNSIATDQISHAYLFMGPRGTGKTSCAKILAKAVNCLHPVDGEPCNQCEICQAINGNSLTDVIEIDAASNNGVDEIRDIRDKVKYPPTLAKYKVYIIDEVHMLSTGAFNALLKTLEEPPMHVIFILATTEIQKVPATVISRTQRFNFRRITASDLIEQMVHILDSKSISYDMDALEVISRAAEGGMRDALSILDQVLSYGQDHVSLANALEVTGDASDQQLASYLKSVFTQNLDQALQEITTLFAGGRSSVRLIEGLIELFRNLLLQQNSPELIMNLGYRPLPSELQEFANQVTAPQLYQLIDLANTTMQQLKVSAHGDLFLEVLTVKFVSCLQDLSSATTEQPKSPVANGSESLPQIKELQQQIVALQGEVQQLSSQAPKHRDKPVSVRATPKSGQVKINRDQIYQVLSAATKNDLEAVRDVWPDMLNKLSPAKKAMLSVSEPVAASPDGIVVAFTYEFTLRTATNDIDFQNDLKKELNGFMKNEANILLIQKDQWPKLRQAYIKSIRQTKVEPSSTDTNPMVKTAASSQKPIVNEAEKRFGDKIIEVKAD